MSKTTLKSLKVTGIFATALLALTACASNSSAETEPAGNTADCVPAAEFDTVVDGKLTIAGVQQLPGLDVDPVSGDVSGLDGVLLVGFAEENCLEPDFQPLPGASAVAALTENKADIGGGGWYRTPERGEVMGQTDPIWYDQLAVFASTPVSNVDDLQGLKVGIVGGAVFEAPLIEAIGTENVVLYQSIDSVIEDVVAGRIDAGMGAGATTTIQINDRDLDLVVSIIEPDTSYPVLTAPGEPNYPYTKSNTALGEALNDYVQRAREDGTVEEVLAQYGVTGDIALNGPKQ